LVFILSEFYIFIIEAVLYTTSLQKYSGVPVRKWKAIIYALIANLFSFIAGLGLAAIIPGNF